MTCDHCPLAGTDAAGLCPGGRYCELTDPAHPHHDPRYARVLHVKAGLAEPEAPAAVPANAEWARVSALPIGSAPPPVPRPEHADLRRMAELRKLVDACPHRGCRAGCGLAKCAAGKGDWEGGAVASHGHCLTCVSGESGPKTLASAMVEWSLSVPIPDSPADRETLNAWFYQKP